MWLLKMGFLGNCNGLGKSSFLMISDKSRLQNCIFNKGAKDSEKMAPECDAFFCHNQIVSLPFLNNYLLSPICLGV